MKAEYMYCVKMSTIGLLHKTFSGSETEAIKTFLKLESRMTWDQALDAGYKVVKVVVVELK